MFSLIFEHLKRKLLKIAPFKLFWISQLINAALYVIHGYKWTECVGFGF